MTTIIDFLEIALAREHHQRDAASCLPGADSVAPAVVDYILRIQARIDLLDALVREAQAAEASAKEEPIAPPHPMGARGAAFSKAFRRGQLTGLPDDRQR